MNAMNMNFSSKVNRVGEDTTLCKGTLMLLDWMFAVVNNLSLLLYLYRYNFCFPGVSGGNVAIGGCKGTFTRYSHGRKPNQNLPSMLADNREFSELEFSDSFLTQDRAAGLVFSVPRYNLFTQTFIKLKNFHVNRGILLVCYSWKSRRIHLRIKPDY